MKLSIALSAFNALTLSPALAAKLLRRSDKPKRAPFRAVNRAIQWAHDHYGRLLQRILRRAVLIVVAVSPADGAVPSNPGTAWRTALISSSSLNQTKLSKMTGTLHCASSSSKVTVS